MLTRNYKELKFVCSVGLYVEVISGTTEPGTIWLYTNIDRSVNCHNINHTFLPPRNSVCGQMRMSRRAIWTPLWANLDRFPWRRLGHVLSPASLSGRSRDVDCNVTLEQQPCILCGTSETQSTAWSPRYVVFIACGSFRKSGWFLMRLNFHGLTQRDTEVRTYPIA